MEVVLLLLPIAVLLALGWTHFPAMTVLFVVYIVAFGVRGLLSNARSARA